VTLFDKFHVIGYVNHWVDETRRAEQQLALYAHAEWLKGRILATGSVAAPTPCSKALLASSQTETEDPRLPLHRESYYHALLYGQQARPSGYLLTVAKNF